MAVLRIGVLGSVRAHRDGEDVDLGGPKQRAVVALLVAAGHGRLVSTDRFVEDLWAGEPPPRALTALHVYVSRLRRVLEPERQARQPAQVLRSAPPGYRLDVPVEAVDAWQVEALVARALAEPDPSVVVGLLDEVETLWGGEPYAAFGDDGWAATEADRLDDLRATAVERRAEALLDLGRAAETVAALSAHARLHPLRERTVELLATGLYREGRQGDALQAVARLRHDLAEELGVDPGPRVRALEADVLAHADHLAAPVVTARPVADVVPPRPAPADDPFVGRAAELARLHAALDGVRSSGRAGVLWVGADAGFGKTALTERFGDEVAGEVVVARGRCPEVDGAPTAWAWTEVLGALGAPGEAGGGAFAIGSEVEQALARYEGRPVLVVLDDLHRADDETLQVLRHVVASTAPALVVGTYRSHQVTPGLGLTFAVVADRTLDRIDLAGLDDEAAARLLGRFGRRAVPAAASAAMVRRSAGNPLFLREIGHLVSAEGAAAGLALPAVIRDLLTRRIERLPPDVVEVLSRAAVLGVDVDVDLLLAASAERGDADEDAILDALDAGLVAGLLDLPAPGELRFTHALVRDTLHERLAPLRRARLHRQLVTVLERDHPDRLEALAHHAAEGLDTRTAARAVDHLEAAATAAAAIGASGDVERHARAALHALDLAGDDPSRRLGLLRRLTDALARTGGVEEARRLRVEAAELAAATGDVVAVAEQLTWDAPTVWTVRPLALVDHDLVARIRDVLDRLPDDRLELRTRLLATLVLETDASELVPVAEAAAQEALDLARRIGDPRLLCQALNAAYFVSFPPRPPGGQQTIGAELLAVAREHGLVTYEAVAHHVLFGAAAGDGDLQTAGVHVAEAVRCGTVGQLPLLVAVGALFGAVVRLVRGDLDGAAASYEELTRQLAASGDTNGEAMGDVLAFCVAHARGDTTAEGDRLRRYLDVVGLRVRDLIVRTRLDAGDPDGARELWRPDDEVFPDYLWGFFATLRAENAARLRDEPACEDWYARLAPWAGRFAGLASGSTTLGPVDQVLGELAVALGRTDDAERHFADAAALARRYGGSTWVERAERSASALARA